MCAPVVLVGGVIGHLFKIAGRGLVRLVVCTQGPVAQEQRDREHQRQGAPNLPAGTHSSELGACHTEQDARLPFAFDILPRGICGT